MGFVTEYWPVMEFQMAEERLVVDSKLNPVTFEGQVRMAFVPESVIASVGGNEMLNIVPKLAVPPSLAVPYKVPP